KFECIYFATVESCQPYSLENKTFAYQSIKHQTDKAVLFDYFGVDLWIPKSKIISYNEEDLTVTVMNCVNIPKLQFSENIVINDMGGDIIKTGCQRGSFVQSI